MEILKHVEIADKLYHLKPSNASLLLLASLASFSILENLCFSGCVETTLQ